MANTVINMNAAGNGYLGQPGTAVAQGQIYNSGAPGTLGSVISGIGTSTTDGSLPFTLNFIDGVQALGQNTIVLNLQSVTAGATINGVANQSIYSGVGSFGQLKVGQSFVVAGFSNGANNGTFTITGVQTSAVQVTNAGPSVAETNFAATGSVTVGRRVAAVRAARSALNFAGTADTSTQVGAIVGVSSITNKGCVITVVGAPGAGTISFLFDVYFDN